jgi:hypothetical protein
MKICEAGLVEGELTGWIIWLEGLLPADRFSEVAGGRELSLPVSDTARPLSRRRASLSATATEGMIMVSSAANRRIGIMVHLGSYRAGAGCMPTPPLSTFNSTMDENYQASISFPDGRVRPLLSGNLQGAGCAGRQFFPVNRRAWEVTGFNYRELSGNLL